VASQAPRRELHPGDGIHRARIRIGQATNVADDLIGGAVHQPCADLRAQSNHVELRAPTADHDLDR
jgi:hypothetical protein